MKIFPKTALTIACALSSSGVYAAQALLPTVTVTADFREAEALKTANSVSVIDAQAIARREAKHLDQLLNTAPNVNYAEGASRGRFVQVRGVGERSQFKDPLDASVGTLIDGIDYSGISLASAMFDVQQVEILRGPQGTQYGSSAMAGLITIQSNQPTEDFEATLSAGVGNYGGRNGGVVVNGAMTDTLLGRIAYQKNISDGYIDNDFIGKDDTNNIDEEVLKAQLKWLLSDQLTLHVSAHYSDVDNGYNAFSLDNSRDIPADDPGHDRQKTYAGSLKVKWTGNEHFDFNSTLFAEHTTAEYGFDWDWSNLDATGVRGGENNLRNRDGVGADVRLLSKPGNEILGGASWIAGAYVAYRDVELKYSDSWEDVIYGGPWLSEFTNKFGNQREALYGQLNWTLGENFLLTSGLRIEHYKTDYRDSNEITATESDTPWGGKLTLEYTGLENSLLYASISRGYKVGGVNGQAAAEAPSLSPETEAFIKSRTIFDAESLINYELGLKGAYLDNTLQLSATAFYMSRKDMQANAWVLSPPAEWVSYRDNVSDGHNTGIELEATWLVSNSLTIFASAGWLETELGDLTVVDVDTDLPKDQSGRAQAHAPQYQYNMGATLQLIENLSLTLEIDGKDGFFFSDSHDDKSDRYELAHMNLSYTLDQVSINAWVRNLADEDYQTRGFYFDNTAPNFDGTNTQAYYQLGAPRTFGVNVNYTF